MRNDIKIADNAIEKKISGVKFIGRKGQIRKINAELLTVNRAVFDRWLAEKAAKVSDLFTSTKINSVERGGGNWLVSSEKNSLKSKIVVFADGPVSSIRRGLGIGFQPFRGNAYGSVIREFHSENNSDLLEMIYDEKVSPAGYGWMFPKKDHVNIGLGFVSSTGCNAKNSMDYLIEKYFQDFSGKKPFLERAALIPCEPARTICTGNGLIAVGDAAGLVEPFTGEGISFGMKSSSICAESVNSALSKNDIGAVANFGKDIRKEFWFKTFVFQSWLLRLLSNHPRAYNIFATKFFISGAYELSAGAASRLHSGIRTISG